MKELRKPDKFRLITIMAGSGSIQIEHWQPDAVRATFRYRQITGPSAARLARVLLDKGELQTILTTVDGHLWPQWKVRRKWARRRYVAAGPPKGRRAAPAPDRLMKIAGMSEARAGLIRDIIQENVRPEEVSRLAQAARRAGWGGTWYMQALRAIGEMIGSYAVEVLADDRRGPNDLPVAYVNLGERDGVTVLCDPLAAGGRGYFWVGTVAQYIARQHGHVK